MKRHFLFLTSFILLTIIGCEAQELKRKAMLGIRMENPSDSINNANEIEGGAYVLSVAEKSNAEKLGLSSGDIITTINGKSIKTINDLVNSISDLRAGDEIKMQYISEGKRKEAKVEVVGRSYETYKGADIHYEKVSYENQTLRSILYLPKGKTNPVVVFFMQGYTCGSTEFPDFPSLSIRKLINDFVDAGYAVFRIEKPGVGDSKGDKHCLEMDINEEIEAFRQGYKALANDERVDSENIILFGHSMGGVVAPVIGAEFNPKGIATYGTLLKSWFEYMVDLTRIQGEIFGNPYAQIEQTTRNAIPFHYDMLVKKEPLEKMLTNKQYQAQLESEGLWEQFKQGMYIGRHYRFWQSLNDVNLTENWQKCNSHVLAIYGEYDIQALNADHVIGIANVINEKNPGKGSYKIIPQADHGFAKFGSMEENVSANSDGQYFSHLMKSYHPGIAKACIEWMNEITN